MGYRIHRMVKSSSTVGEAAEVARLRLEAQSAARLDSLTRRLEELGTRVEKLEEGQEASSSKSDLAALESRLSSLEHSVRAPKNRPKGRLSREEWLSQRREIMRENAKKRWKPKPKKPKDRKR